MGTIVPSLTDVPGVGTEWAKRMRRGGIETPSDLAEAEPSDLAELGTIEDWRAEEWIEAASEIQYNSAETAANRSSEGRACADESGPKSGSGSPVVPEGEDEFERLWSRLTDNQRKVAQEYLFTSSKADAAREVGLTPSCVYSWPDYVWEAARMLIDRRKSGISEGMSALSPAALDVLRRALDPQREVSRVEAESAQYLLNQLEGKPTQKSEVEVEGGIDVSESDKEALDEALSHLGGDGE